MDGPGSGRRSASARTPSTDDALALDVRHLAQRGLLGEGRHTFTWPSMWGDATIRYVVAGNALTLQYRTREVSWEDWRDVHQSVAIARTPCHYGGDRPWFICPACGDRVAILWLLGGHFRCRSCQGLAYASTREDRSKPLLRKANRLRASLGGEAGLGRVPARPSWLSYRAYWCVLKQIWTLESEYVTEIEPQLNEWRKLLRGKTD